MKKKVLYAVEVLAEEVGKWNEYCRTWTGIDLKPEQMVDVIKATDEGGEFFRLYFFLGEFETELRERFMSLISQHLLKKNWMDGKTVDGDLEKYTQTESPKAFMQELHEAARKAGYRVMSWNYPEK